MRKLLLPFFLLALSSLLAAPPAQRITSASAVVLRAGPTINSAEVGRLKLGTILEVTGRSPGKTSIGSMNDHWYQVKTSDKSGWIFGGLLREYDQARKDEVQLDIARARLARKSDSFLEWTELFDFCAEAAQVADKKDARAKLELCRLLAVSRACDARRKDPWFQKHADLLVYHEPAGQFVLKAELMWKLHKKYKRSAPAEDIAYAASQLILPGECEGFLECSLHLWRITDGRYVKLYPSGKFVEQILMRTEKNLGYFLNNPIQDVPGTAIDEIEGVMQIVSRAKTAGAARNRVMESLKRIRAKHASP